MDIKYQIWIATHRGLSKETKALIEGLKVKCSVVEGCSDTALARNIVFTECAESKDEFDIALFLDDDIAGSPADIIKLLEWSKELDRPVSGVYISTTGEIGAYELTRIQETGFWGKRRWLTGLGCMAVPRRYIDKLYHSSQTFKLKNRELKEFTYSGVDSIDGNTEWFSEDYRFCKRLRGVALAPLAFGHVKPAVIMPSDESLDPLRNHLPFEVK